TLNADQDIAQGAAAQWTFAGIDVLEAGCGRSNSTAGHLDFAVRLRETSTKASTREDFDDDTSLACGGLECRVRPRHRPGASRDQERVGRVQPGQYEAQGLYGL